MRGRALRVLVPGVAVLALVGIVAIAATGATTSGSNGGGRSADVLLDTILTLGALALLPAFALLVYGLMQRREVATEYARFKRRRSGIASLVVLFAALVVIYHFRHPPPFNSPPQEPPVSALSPGAVTPTPGANDVQYEPRFAWIPALVVVSLVAIAGGAALLASRRRKPAIEAGVAETLADVLQDTLDDLRAEADPRRAVIAAYARLERALAVHGFPRRPSETQEEFLARILGSLDVGTGSIRRLTDLFTQAKFSPHEVDEGMKEEAIAALEQVRDELRAADARKPAELETAQAAQGNA